MRLYVVQPFLVLTVEKIGGTSMTAFADVLQNIIFHGREGPDLYNRIFVVSAYANVTNWLLENKKTGAPGVYHRITQHQEFRAALQDVAAKLQGAEQDTTSRWASIWPWPTPSFSSASTRPRPTSKASTNVLASGYVNSANILQAAREILASIGEAHSAFNSVNILQNRGVNATLVDLSGFDDARALTIDERIRQAFAGIDFADTICIATGYTKGTEGIMREFDRGYSEVTFSKIAVAVQPQEAIIHKEYHLCSADPNLVGLDQCRPVGFTNYDVADQLADVGMEAIHPKASKPLEINAINLRIKNTFEPDAPRHAHHPRLRGARQAHRSHHGHRQSGAHRHPRPADGGHRRLRPAPDAGVFRPRRELHLQGHQRQQHHAAHLGKRPAARSCSPPWTPSTKR